MRESVVDMAMHDIADESGVRPGADWETRDRARLPVIERMQAERRRPREISHRDLVPPHIRDRYQELWQAEDRAHLAAAALEAAPPAPPRKGLLRRLLSALW